MNLDTRSASRHRKRPLAQACAGLAALALLAAAPLSQAQGSSPGSADGPNRPSSGSGMAPSGMPSGMSSGMSSSSSSNGSLSSGTGEAGSTSYSLLPYTQQGYVGLSVGSPNYDVDCGVTSLFSCDDPSTSWKIYTGGMVNQYFGAEIAYLDMGDADRYGGTARARGLNLSLVGRYPVAPNLAVFGKVGATYGRTRVSASPLALATSGKDSGWGGSYGVGASFDFARHWSAVVEWERHDFHFAGQGRDAVSTTSLGVKYRF